MGGKVRITSELHRILIWLSSDGRVYRGATECLRSPAPMRADR